MQLILCTIIVFISTFLIQTLFIIRTERKQKNKLNEIDIEKEYRRNMKIVVKFLIALIISSIFAVISFYGFGIAIIGALREGH
ncbi:MAG: hypothetical protein IJE05_02935 [Clostridia bacterium]|nr:hypothetical protein [Clostridia bacterium]